MELDLKREVICPTCAQPVKVVTVSVGGGKRADYGLCKECGRQWRL